MDNANVRIARLWHGAVPEEKADEYYQYLIDTGIKDYQSTDGFCDLYLLRRNQTGHMHFLLLTIWDSYESIKKFAGNDIDRARYYPKDKEYLLELEPFVEHYEIG